MSVNWIDYRGAAGGIPDGGSEYGTLLNAKDSEGDRMNSHIRKKHPCYLLSCVLLGLLVCPRCSDAEYRDMDLNGFLYVTYAYVELRWMSKSAPSCTGHRRRNES